MAPITKLHAQIKFLYDRFVNHKPTHILFREFFTFGRDRESVSSAAEGGTKKKNFEKVKKRKGKKKKNSINSDESRAEMEKKKE